jgi:hypothetical protein
MKSTYTSHELYHFVGRRAPSDHQENYRILHDVLQNRCISHPPHQPDWGEVRVTIRWTGRVLDQDLVVPTVVCFCDIPRDHLAIHIGKYGHFGVSLERDVLIRYGARPVTYWPIHSEDWRGPFGEPLLRDIEQIFKSFQAQVLDKIDLPEEQSRTMGSALPDSPSACSAVDSLLQKDVLAFIKPFDAELADDHPANYYLEREWRKYGNMMFEPAWVQSVLVAEGYVARIEREFPEYRGKIEVA